MKPRGKARGYGLAAIAAAACVGTWVAVVSADEGLGRMTGTYVDTMRTGAVCSQFVYQAHQTLVTAGVPGARPSLHDVCELSWHRR